MICSFKHAVRTKLKKSLEHKCCDRNMKKINSDKNTPRRLLVPRYNIPTFETIKISVDLIIHKFR